MKDILEDINDFITDPQGEDDSVVVGINFLLYIFGIIGWVLSYYLLSYYFIYKYPVWIAVVCWSVSVCCGIVWYNISDDYGTRSKITHYAYAFLSVLLNGSWLIAFPVMVVFVVITIPLWIGSLIKR